MGAPTRNEFEERLAELAAGDPSFRQELLSNPKKTISELTGVALPDDLNVVVHEENESTLHFVLPPGAEQLTAAEMSEVSGGLCWSNCSTVDDLPGAP